jgi:hypothetical protein
MITETKKISFFPCLSNKQFTTFICSIIAGVSMLCSFNVFALGQLMVSPTRVVFEGGERAKQINLINNGSETGRFKISFVRRNMNAEGQIEVVDENTPGMYSDGMVRFSPRLVTLEPGQSQTVRLMLRKKRDLPDGEYRSHMMFQSLPDASASDVSTLSSDKPGELSVQLIPVVGITIPVIVRQGKLQVKVSISDFEIKQSNTVKDQSVLSLTMHREGNESSYGDFRVYFTPKNGTPVVIGQISGVAIYTSTDSRKLDINLQMPPGLSLSNGELRITFLKRGENEKTGLITEAKLAVP